MSSAQDLFRQKRAEKGANKPNWKELKAKKLQQQAQEQKKAAAAAAASFPKPSAPAAAPSSYPKPSPAVPPTASKGLPPDFFQNQAPGKPTPLSAPTTTPTQAATAPVRATKVTRLQHPAAAVPATTGAAGKAGPAGAGVPKGFFADAEADAKVRGERLPTKQDKEEEFKEFQKMMEEEINVAARVEAEEAAEAAEERREREEFEQMMRLKMVNDLRSLRQPAGEAPHSEAAVVLAGGKRALSELVEPDSRPNLDDVALPSARRRRVIDVLKEELEGGDSEGSDEDDGGDDIEGELLNWRAKTV